MDRSRAPAIVMNMFYTGLGIARNLGEMGIPVIGLGAHCLASGNFSRFCKFVPCPDSRDRPDELVDFLVRLGRDQKQKPVIFPTRDHDVIFLAQRGGELRDHFIIPMPGWEVIDNIINKWKMLEIASLCRIPVPRSYLIESPSDLERLGAISFPCVLKPVYSASWRAKGAWRAVGGRKAISVSSFDELCAEYQMVSRVERQAIVQELIAGGDDQLYILGSYLNSRSEPLAYFAARKLVQYPEGFGTGCLIESVRLEELEELTFRLLKFLGYHGISEVEYKRDPSDGKFKLIEINPRHWDWHRLGTRCGANLSYVAYRDLTGDPIEKRCVASAIGVKWVAEREFFLFAAEGLISNGLALGRLRGLAKGKKEYGSFSWNDPLPGLVALFQLSCQILAALARRLLRPIHMLRPRRGES